MLKIRSADKVAQSLVTELVTLLTDAGAFFNDALQLDVKGSDFSYSQRKALGANERLVSLPLRCMPILDDFEWSLDEHKNLYWEAAKAPQADDFDFHKQIVDLLVQLYNRLGKLADYGRHFPVVQLASKRPLVERLLEFGQEHLFRTRLDEGPDQLLIHAFWYGRIFSDSLTHRIHIIPLMEFFDHSIFAGSFFGELNERGERSLNLSYKSPGKNKGLNARYEIMDNLHAFVKYGFVDEQAFFVQSQPFVVDLKQGAVRLEVSYQSASTNQCQVDEWNPAPSYSNSLMYRSRLRFLTDCVFMSYMMVPPARHLPAFDEALIAQLREIERHKGMEAGHLSNAGIVREVKLALLAENEAAYRSINQAAREADLDTKAPATRLLKKMLRHQRQILAEFRETLQ